MLIWLALAAFFLSYANGANDNFKGVATLLGSGAAGYRRALWWATATTFAGSCAAVLLSGRLLAAFSGHGIVPETLTRDPAFLLAVGLGAALTVMIASLSGWPISTTHALTGALVGAGLAGAGSVKLAMLGSAFFLPLAVSPFLSLALTAALYPGFRFLRTRLGVERQMCWCLEEGSLEPVQIQADGSATLPSSGVRLSIGQLDNCVERYRGRLLGFDAQQVLDRFHFLSAGAVSFARGLNDAPKVAALLVAAPALQLDLPLSLFLIGLLMAVGGLLNARRVAATMSHRITDMNHGQGFAANLSTALMVLFASRWGLPVSTTHVSCGSLFGLGAVTGAARWKTIRGILLAWLLTLPTAALLAAAVYWLA